MDYLDFRDTIDYNKFNALVYLLRKFKKLTSELELGAYDINTDYYGSFHFTEGFVPVGNNWILEDNVTVTGSNVLLNSFYTFVFAVVDVNTSGVVNKRLIRVTSESTGETGTLELTIPSDLIGTDEVILPNFTLEVVFDEHEYYTPLPDVHLSLSVDKQIIDVGEVATITGLLTDSTSTPVENVSLPLNVDGTTVTVITDSTGEFNYAYTGTGTRGKVLVSALGESVFFYDGLINIMGATVTGNNVSIGKIGTWLFTTGDVVIDWGDGTSDTVNNPNVPLSHVYSDGLSEHLIIFDGTVTSLGSGCFEGCSGLTSVVIPDSVTILGNSCFNGCSGLTSVTIPDSVTRLGSGCFEGCSGLIDYELYWETSPITYDSRKMPVNNGTVFTIPTGTTSIYTDAGYPVANLVERGESLTLTCDKPLIQNNETSTITATLKDTGTPLTSKTLNYQIKHGDTIITSGTKTTNNNGQATIQYTGTGIGEVTIEVKYGNTTQNSFNIIDATYIDNGVNYLNRLTSTTVTNGIQLTAPVDNYGMMYFSENSSASSTFYLEPNSIFEFDIIEYDGTFIIRCDSTSENQQLFTHTDVTAPCHVKIINKGTNIEYFIDGVRYNKTGVTSDNRRLTIRVNANGILTYNNLCYYGYVQPTPVPDTILVTGTSIIEKGDTDMLTACLLDGSVPVEGETLSYEIKHGATVIDSGSDTTDSNGEISISYTGTGVGDVSVEVSYGTLLQKTYSIEDCINYDSLTSASGKWTIPSGVTSQYSSDGWKVSANAYKQIKLTEKLTSDCSVEFTVVDYSTPTSSYTPVIVYAYTNGETTPNQMIMMNYLSRIDVLGTSINHALVKGAVYKIEYTASTIKVYENDTLLASASNSVGLPTRFEFHMGANGRYAIYKDLKVKPL